VLNQKLVHHFENLVKNSKYFNVDRSKASQVEKSTHYNQK
jgi:hypothetical protein